MSFLEPVARPSSRSFDGLGRGGARRVALAALFLGALVAPSASCTGSLAPAPIAASGGDALGPGEYCESPEDSLIQVRAEPAVVFVPPCTDPAAHSCIARKVSVIIDPDFCASPTACTQCNDACSASGSSADDCSVRCSSYCADAKPLLFRSSDSGIVAAPAADSLYLHHARVDLEIVGGATTGSATITAAVPLADGTEATGTIAVEVLDDKLPTCTGPDTASKPALAGGQTLEGEGELAGASIGMPEGADAPNSGSFIWSVAPFDADLGCGADMSDGLPGYVPLGPAIAFGPDDAVWKRELPISVPVNPARLPAAARFRHVVVAYSGPAFKAPRVVPIADPAIEKIGGAWALRFGVPRLGTYQAFVKKDAGGQTRDRRLTHRGVVGISMGAGGTALFGLRHHDLFDVVAPLGGFVDWNWFVDYTQTHKLGGFRPIAPGTQLADIPIDAATCQSAVDCKADETCLGVLTSPPTPGKCRFLPEAADSFAHPETFNTWWLEYPRNGNGGGFPRDNQIQIFRDIALMFGNPNGDNLAKGGEHLPAGVPPDHPSQVGDHPNGECKYWVEPLDGPDHDKQAEINDNCPKERCAHTLVLQSYFDDEFNPDGTFPVITFCDGSPQNQALTPYSDTWSPDNNQYPFEPALAVDYNGNGVRDELEPVIRAGQEPFADVGEDGLADADEPGYSPDNLDPAGDNYHAQYNPTGTENDHHHQDAEPFDDWGLDGVPGTLQQPADGWKKPGDGYDVGEGDGVWTASRGAKNFLQNDPHAIAMRWSKAAPGGDLDDDALARIDVWTDGGTRDLANFAVGAQHLAGAFAARGRNTVYFTDFARIPGLDPKQPDQFDPARIVFDDLQGIVMQRYGKTEPTADDIEAGSGQHVGTANEIAKRLQTALYFIGSRWPDPELRQLVKDSYLEPSELADGYTDASCEVGGNCTIEFTSSFGRTGPVGITLPPGYALRGQEKRRYPVIYLLHGYGQSPEDLEAAIVFLRNWMNSPSTSIESRLPKAILVYVDGRCRVGKDGKAECIRGNFFADSPREGGARIDAWWLELMDHVDATYRTLGERHVSWSE